MLKNILIFFYLFSILSIIPLSAEEINVKVDKFSDQKNLLTEDKKDFPNIKTTSENNKIYNLTPQKNKETSLIKTLSLDILLPGGGHFYNEEYFSGGSFAALKLIGAFSIYYFNKKMNKAKDEYIYKKNNNLSYNSNKHLYERNTRFYTFSIAFELIVYATSLFINYNKIQELNEKSIPTFEFTALNDYHKDKKFIIKYSYNFF